MDLEGVGGRKKYNKNTFYEKIIPQSNDRDTCKVNIQLIRR